MVFEGVDGMIDEEDRGVLILVTIESGFEGSWIKVVAPGFGFCQGSKWTANGSHFTSRLVGPGWGNIDASEASRDPAKVDDRHVLLTDVGVVYKTENAGEFDVELIKTTLLDFSLMIFVVICCSSDQFSWFHTLYN